MNFIKISAFMMFACTSLLFGVKEKDTHKQKSSTHSQQASVIKPWSEHRNKFIRKTAQEVAQKQLGHLQHGNPLLVEKTIDVGEWNFNYLTLTAVVLQDSAAPRLGHHEIYRDGSIAVTAKTILYI
jgi:hypothetical protein